MGNRKRKIRKEKILAEKRRNEIRKAQIKELETLKSKVLDFELTIKLQKKENFKQFNIRNLKVLTNTCKFLAPFVISTGITVGAFWFFQGGLPFHLDEMTEYKLYNMEYQKNGYVAMDNKYINILNSNASPSNSLVVYTPWEFKDGQYVRFKRNYDISKLASLDLYNAIANRDYNYISDNLNTYKEEKQVINEIYLEEKNDYLFEASLYVLDKSDVLNYPETDFKNTVITIIEMVIGLGIGGLVTYFGDFNFSDELERINKEYKAYIELLKSMQKELVDTKEKILSLTKTKGGKYNE